MDDFETLDLPKSDFTENLIRRKGKMKKDR